MERKLKMSVGIGGPSIIMIFVILCLTTLGALSLMTANADWKLTTKTAQSITDYYTADNAAEEFLAKADASLKAGEPLKTDNFTVQVNDHQDLILKIRTEGDRISVICHELVPKSQWNYDDYTNEFNDSIVE